MFSSNNNLTLKASPTGEVQRGPYIIPTAETMLLRTEHAVLTASEIPMGGETGHFDTRTQNDWADEWSECSDE